jgi:uncharacterized protein YdhG (YjbR/CyaY superfamily)
MKLNVIAVDEYLALQSQEKQLSLHELRDIIRKTAPEAEEGIFWNMPGYRWNGPLVYFAAYKNHIGFYPGPDAIAEYADKLTGYKTSKGAIQFSYVEVLPKKMIEDIIVFRMKQNEQKKKSKKG